MKKFEEEFNYLIELSGKVLTGQIEAEKFEKQRAIFLNEYGKKQQPEIPEFMAKAVEEFKKQPDIYKGFSNVNEVWSWLNEYQMNNDDFGICGLNNKFFVLAHFAINGYTVAKEKRFYLKAKELLVVGDYDHVEDLWLDFNKNYTPKKSMAHKFTQKEIDNMETGSYEQIEVEE